MELKETAIISGRVPVANIYEYGNKYSGSIMGRDFIK
jgi:hypothetical protein